ncbi:MAG TPA: TSUP family transporter [Actinospica sp.]|nr:TSUP family transporter [Actinospica sp.]
MHSGYGLFAHLGPPGIAFACVAALVAGAVDAMVGGGGLIQLPALLFLLPNTPVVGLGTNKVASFVGTSTAAGRYLRRTKVEWRSAAPMAAVALVGSLCGAHVASLMPAAVLDSIVLAAMVCIAVYLWRNKAMGIVETLRFDGAARVGVMALGGLAIGFWDGMAGPGTGSLLIFYLVSAVGFEFLRASAVAKIVNCATNIGALLVFAPSGQVAWGLAAAMALCNLSGALVGTALATTRGSGFIRKVFFGVVSLLIVSLAGKLALG